MQVLSSFHCAKTIESLLFTSMRSNLYSGGIHARRPIIHTCRQQKNTCNIDFLLSHIRIYTPSAQLHHIQKAMNRSWCPFSCVVQGVLKSHRKGKTIILQPSFWVHARLCPIITLPRFISSQRLLVVVFTPIVQLPLDPLSFDFLARDCRQGQIQMHPHDQQNSDVPFYFHRVSFISKLYLLLSYNLIYTTELRRQGSP